MIRAVSSPSATSHHGVCQDVICPIRSHRRRSSWRGHVGSSARSDDDAPFLNIFQGRRCLEMDIEAMEPGKGQVGRGKGKMGGLPEAIRGPKFDGPEELVISSVLHDAGISVVQDRRCLPMDITAMESGKGQVGKRNTKVGRLSEAIERSKFGRTKELVVPRVLHDQLSNCCFNGTNFVA